MEENPIAQVIDRLCHWYYRAMELSTAQCYPMDATSHFHRHTIGLFVASGKTTVWFKLALRMHSIHPVFLFRQFPPAMQRPPNS